MILTIYLVGLLVFPFFLIDKHSDLEDNSLILIYLMLMIFWPVVLAFFFFTVFLRRIQRWKS